MFKKITVGFVTQIFDDSGNCVIQSFTCGDECDYEDQEGNPIDPPNNETYHPYDMVQPIRSPK